MSLLPGSALHEGSSPLGLDELAAVLGEVVAAFDASGVPYVLVGGLASTILGRPRCSSDIDVLVTPERAPDALAALARAGFRTEETNPHWLYKGFRGQVLVDILFKARGEIYLDDEMLRRASRGQFRGVPVRIVPAEDLVVMKAIVHDEETPRHWADALGLVAACTLDWDYLLLRARRAPRRVLSFLLYASSVDLPVQRRALRRLAHEVLYERD